MSTYTYSLSGDFPSGLSPPQLRAEIEFDPGIAPTCTVVISENSAPDDVLITFDSALSGPELTTLAAVIAAHIPSPSNIEITSDGYIEINSSLADTQAIQINASNTAGGIDIDAGTGGITIDTTNAISLDAGAASNFTTSTGDITVDAAGVARLEGGGGIAIGSNAVAQAITIGASASARTITLGNQNTTTTTNIQSGTGGVNIDSTGQVSLDASGASSNFTLATTGDSQDLTIALTGSNNSSIIVDSAGTGADAIRLNTTGGIDVDATGTINIASGDNTGSAIVLDAAFNNGGVSISSGSQGVAINSNGGLIGIGHWSGGDMSIGTAAVARNMTIGNITGTTSVTINSGTGGINIGGNSSTGEIHIANTAIAKSLFIGNNTSGSRMFLRRGTGGAIRSQPAPVSLSDADVSLSVANLLAEILTGTPTSDRTLTLPTAALVVSGISGIAVDDSIDFYIINKSTVDDAEWILAMGTGGTMDGNANISPKENVLNTYKNNGSSHFRLRMTNVTASSEAYTVYRLG